jgi:trehalose 6-phosphate phosphatase
VAEYPALQLEHKNLALSLHYRHAPELEALCLQVMQTAVAKSSGLQLMQGKCVIDLKLRGFSKGTAIASFMNEPPFAGRVPVFAGDDVTDEDGFVEIERLGGYAVKVGPGATNARYRCSGVPELAAWLQSALVPSLASRAESLPS